MSIPTENEIRAWVASAMPPSATRGWYGACAGLTDRVVAAFTDGSRQWFDSATDAMHASGPLNPDPTICPPGGMHFWSYMGTAWDGSFGDWGHVGPEIIGGGRGLLSATGYAYESWALNAGLITVAAQSARPGMRYLGWARTFGNAPQLIIRTEAAAGGGGTPWQPPQKKEWDEMASREEIRAEFAAEAGALLARAGLPGVRTVHFRTEGGDEWTLGDPELGRDLQQFTGTVDETTRRDLGDGVFLFRGFMVTADAQTGAAWARTYAKGLGGETSRTDRAGYIAIQRELSRVATLSVS